MNTLEEKEERGKLTSTCAVYVQVQVHIQSIINLIYISTHSIEPEPRLRVSLNFPVQLITLKAEALSYFPIASVVSSQYTRVTEKQTTDDSHIMQ